MLVQPRLLLSITLVMSANVAALASATPDPDDDESEEVDSIQVTATRTKGLVRDEPIRVEVVPTEEIEENLTIQPGNISTLARELGGLQVRSTSGALGGESLQMR